MQMLGSRSGGSANFDSPPPEQNTAQKSEPIPAADDDFDDDIPF
jgi:hypothetical protein